MCVLLLFLLLFVSLLLLFVSLLLLFVSLLFCFCFGGWTGVVVSVSVFVCFLFVGLVGRVCVCISCLGWKAVVRLLFVGFLMIISVL